jgi:hypothetical protein
VHARLLRCSWRFQGLDRAFSFGIEAFRPGNFAPNSELKMI